MDDFEKLKEELLSDPEVRKEYDALEPEFQQARRELKAFGMLARYAKDKPYLEAEKNAWQEAVVEKYQRKRQEELLDTFTEERECDYKDRHYKVRDNGSVLRLPKDPAKTRKGDNEWTFGTFNKRNGYLFIGSHQVHRIVATAFHGKPEAETDIVDHIDTDRQNNEV